MEVRSVSLPKQQGDKYLSMHFSYTHWFMMPLNKSHPMQIAEFAVVQGIDHYTAFNWWVMHAHKKRDGNIASVKKWQKHI